jgi:hypothetical protein
LSTKLELVGTWSSGGVFGNSGSCGALLAAGAGALAEGACGSELAAGAGLGLTAGALACGELQPALPSKRIK